MYVCIYKIYIYIYVPICLVYYAQLYGNTCNIISFDLYAYIYIYNIYIYIYIRARMPGVFPGFQKTATLRDIGLTESGLWVIRAWFLDPNVSQRVQEPAIG